MPWTASQFSLADFYFSDTDSPLVPPPEYLEWRRETAWATSLYEPVLCDPAGPINHLQKGTGTAGGASPTASGGTTSATSWRVSAWARSPARGWRRRP